METIELMISWVELIGIVIICAGAAYAIGTVTATIDAPFINRLKYDNDKRNGVQWKR